MQVPPRSVHGTPNAHALCSSAAGGDSPTPSASVHLNSGNAEASHVKEAKRQRGQPAHVTSTQSGARVVSRSPRERSGSRSDANTARICFRVPALLRPVLYNSPAGGGGGERASQRAEPNQKPRSTSRRPVPSQRARPDHSPKATERKRKRERRRLPHRQPLVRGSAKRARRRVTAAAADNSARPTPSLSRALPRCHRAERRNKKEERERRDGELVWSTERRGSKGDTYGATTMAKQKRPERAGPRAVNRSAPRRRLHSFFARTERRAPR